MGYVCLLGTAQLLRSGNQIVHQCSHFLFYIALGMVLVFYENPTSRRQDVLERNVVQCNIGTMNALICRSHVFQEINSLRRTVQIVECSLLHWQAHGSLLLAKGSDQFL